MLKLKHLRHPLRTAQAARDLLANYWAVRKLTARGERRFRGDPRYDLQNVTDGFASRLDDGEDDTELLHRICKAYNKAASRQLNTDATYGATEWWQNIQRRSLTPVQHALATHDIPTLHAMYRNFFRNPCGAGLIEQPLHTTKASSSTRVNKLYRRFFLVDALSRLDYWTLKTGARFALRDLTGPGVGNPFGVQIEDTLLQTGAEYQHYCARRILDILHAPAATVTEIGGGFGGMAYYLLRDQPKITYIDFDVPESLALTAYYLLKSFPERKFLLYGEDELGQEAINRFNVILMPPFELGNTPSKSIDLTFSSHTIPALSRAARVEYLHEIARITRDSFLCIGKERPGEALDALVDAENISLKLMEKNISEWNSQRVIKAIEVECLFGLGEREQAAAIM
jgi:hypothetical protein